MSEKTPAARPAAKPVRKATGPTKAAALKKLGLTQEDLDTLKAVTDARELAAKKVDPAELEAKTVAQQEAKTELYRDLQEAGEKIPADLSPATDPADAVWFMRNLRGTEVRLRLTRQPKGNVKPLKPRGSRGDLQKLHPEDLSDDILLDNVNLGVVEIIPEQEARLVLEKQVINTQQAVHPAIAMLRGPLGKPYEEGAVKVEPEFGSQGVVVAHLDPAQMQGKVDDKTVARGNPVQRVQPGQQPIGNPAIFSDGFADADLDAIARRKDIEGPAAGIGGLSVSVAPVERS